jgi:hypothetical protein
VLGSLAVGGAISASIFYKDWKIPQEILEKQAAQDKAASIAKAANIAATKRELLAQVAKEHNSVV